MRFQLFGLFFCILVLHGQTPLGTVSGLAIDASGGAVAAASVTLTNNDTGVRRTASTNASGAYSFPDLPPGTYRLGADAKGFRPIETRAFAVEAYRSVRQDFKFEISSTSTEVVVTEAASAVVQLESPAVGSSLAPRQIIETPTNLRSVSKNSGDSGLISSILPLTVPGVVQVGNGAKWLTPGAGATSVKVKVDGIETTFGNFGSPDNVSQPSVEAIQEFTASLLTTRAEFGGMGTITTATKSGSNAYHGGLFWYLRNSGTDARNAFATSKPFQNLHNYGGTFGGPIRRDKTFFFFDFDGLKGVAATLFTPNVPTRRHAPGRFFRLRRAEESLHRRQSLHREFDLPRHSSASQALKSQDFLFPLPNFGAPTLTAANYRASFTGPEVHRTEEIKLDHNFTDSHRVFLRYENRKDDYNIPGARSALPPTTVGTSYNQRRVNFWTVGDILAIRPNLLNEVRAGVVVLVSASSSNFTGQGILQQTRHSRPPRPRPHPQPADLQRHRLCQRQHQPVEPGQRRSQPDRRQSQLDARPPHHEVRRRKGQLLRQPLHAEHVRNSGLRQLRLHRQIHRQRLRRFPARTARHGHAPGTLPCPVQPFPRLVHLRPGRFQSQPQAHPDVRPALGIQRPRLHAQRQRVLFRSRHRQNRGAQPGGR